MNQPNPYTNYNTDYPPYDPASAYPAQQSQPPVYPPQTVQTAYPQPVQAVPPQQPYPGYAQYAQYAQYPAQPQPVQAFPAQPVPAGQGYPAPAYPIAGAPAYQAMQAAQAPAFAVRQKDPRRVGAGRTLNRMGLLMVAQTVLSLVLQLAVILICLSWGDISPDIQAQVIMVIGLSPICTAGPMLCYMCVGHKDWNQYLRFERRGFFGGLLVVFAALGICMAANIPAGLVDELLKDLGAREAADVLGEGGSWVNFAIEFVGVAVLVPLMEEFAFRGVILSSLRKHGTAFAIIASGIIFGMAHMSLTSVVFAMIAGIAMGAAYVITGNLWVTVAIHALNNGLAVIESYSGLVMGEAQQELFNGAVTIAAMALGGVCLLILLIFRRKLFKNGPSVPPVDAVNPPLKVGEILGRLVKSPVLWAILAMVLVETAMLFV